MRKDKEEVLNIIAYSKALDTKPPFEIAIEEYCDNEYIVLTGINTDLIPNFKEHNTIVIPNYIEVIDIDDNVVCKKFELEETESVFIKQLNVIAPYVDLTKATDELWIGQCYDHKYSNGRFDRIGLSIFKAVEVTLPDTFDELRRDMLKITCEDLNDITRISIVNTTKEYELSLENLFYAVKDSDRRPIIRAGGIQVKAGRGSLRAQTMSSNKNVDDFEYHTVELDICRNAVVEDGFIIKISNKEPGLDFIFQGKFVRIQINETNHQLYNELKEKCMPAFDENDIM